jgi:hypothetical protein
MFWSCPMSHKELRTRLWQFTFDDPTAQRPFSTRLAEENGWTREFTMQAIEEYRRFLFLAVTCDHAVVPSEVVARVWQLHLIYTRSYWDDLCGHTLGKPLHHQPAPGKDAMRAHFQPDYKRTLESYEREFGSPPVAIWPRVAETEAGESEEKQSQCDRATPREPPLSANHLTE